MEAPLWSCIIIALILCNYYCMIFHAIVMQVISIIFIVPVCLHLWLQLSTTARTKALFHDFLNLNLGLNLLQNYRVILFKECR